MTWQVHELIYELKSPLSIGWHKQGKVSRTRLYIPGRNIWAALTENIVYKSKRNIEDKTFKDVGNWLKENTAFTYFFLIDDNDNIVAWSENNNDYYTWYEKYEKEVSVNFVTSYISTAIDPDTGSAEDETLHDVEVIGHRYKKDTYKFDGSVRPVRIKGYMFLKNKPDLTEGHLCNTFYNKPVEFLKELAIGGDRSYGLGRIHLTSEKLNNYKDNDLIFNFYKAELTGSRPALKVVNNYNGIPLLAHLEAHDNINNHLRGEVEAIAGFNNLNSNKGTFYENNLYWMPGSILETRNSNVIFISFKINDEMRWSVWKTINCDFISDGSTVQVSEEDNKKVFKSGNKVFDYNSTLFLDVGNKLDKGIIDHHHIDIEKDPIKNRSAASLLKDNTDFIEHLKDKKEITIVVHCKPDFDCFASVFLASEYFINNTFPNNYFELVNYAEEIDSGRKGINYNKPASYCTVAQMIQETFRKDMDPSEKNMKNLEKGLLLCKLLVDHARDKKKAYMADLSDDTKEYFKNEIELIEIDKVKYENDKNENKCIESKVRLSNINKEKEFIEVKALIWNEIPSCKLHKNWARAEGFVFTFIPQKIDDIDYSYLEDDILKKVKVFKNNKVTISVDPNSNASLKYLGMCLELEELNKEKNNNVNKRRLEGKRYPEVWCKNDDPWYDGRNHNYTIVESPRVGSILTLNEIQNVALNYAKPIINKDASSTRILFPFLFEPEHYSELCELLEKSNDVDIVEENNIDERKRYFRSYIWNYYFDKNSNLSKKYGIKKEIEMNTKEDVTVKVESSSIYLFRYGVGFLCIEVKYNIKESADNKLLYFHDILNVNHSLCTSEGKKRFLYNFNDIFNKEVKDKLKTPDIIKKDTEPRTFVNADALPDKDNDIFYERALIFSCIVIDTPLIKLFHTEELIHKLCSNQGDVLLLDLESNHVKESLEDMFYDIYDWSAYGFSKSGGALLIIDNHDLQNCKGHGLEFEEKKEGLKKNFSTIDFDIFLIVLHQRYCMMNFSDKLSKYGPAGDKKSISKLRKNVLDFVVQEWFSQITNDEIGMIKYKKWQTVFETEKLHDEIRDQVTTLDDFNEAERKKKIDKISAVMVPLVALNLIIGILNGLFKDELAVTNNWSNNIWLIFVSTILIGVLATGIILGWWKKVLKLVTNIWGKLKEKVTHIKVTKNRNKTKISG